MTGANLYLRPLGFLYGAAAKAAIGAGQAGALAGGPIAFGLVEVIEGAAGQATRRIHSFADLSLSNEAGVRTGLDRLMAPRPPLAGLTFERPLLMGVVNVTPDSFSDGGLYDRTEDAVAHAAALASEGADIVDIGGESTRPGADPVPPEEELARVAPVLAQLRGLAARLSIDTRRPAVMRAAAAAGVHLINDVSALTHDPASLEAARDSGLPVILMHAQGDPKTMQERPSYADVQIEVFDYLAERIAACEAAGIPRSRLIADPGIGFGKTLEHNLDLLAGIGLLHGLGVPLCVGTSRKAFIGRLTGETEPARRVFGSVASALACAAQGAQILRVHDVAQTRQALSVWQPVVHGAAGA